jgi:hypothetical protein
MANKKISQLTPKGSALAGTDLVEVSVFNGVTYDTKSLTGANILSGTGLTVGTTAIASGTVGRVLFEGTGNVVQQSAGLSFATANNQLNIGTSTYLKGGTSYLDSFANGWGLYNCGLQSTFSGNNKDLWNLNTLSIGFASASARLDVKAAGALSTDIALRVRNSANTANLFSVQGDGVSNVLTRFNCGFSGMTTTGGALHVYAGNSNDFISRWFNTAGAGIISIRTVSNGGQLTISSSSGVAGITLDGQNSNALTLGAGRNISFDTATGTKIGSTTSQKFAFWNTTPIVTTNNSSSIMRHLCQIQELLFTKLARLTDIHFNK